MDKKLRAGLFGGAVIAAFNYAFMTYVPGSVLQYALAIGAFSSGFAWWGMKNG